MNVALMLTTVLGLKNFGPMHCRILRHDDGYLWLERLRQPAILQLMEYAISRARGSPWHLDFSNHWRGSVDHSWEVWQIHGESTSYCCRTG